MPRQHYNAIVTKLRGVAALHPYTGGVRVFAMGRAPQESAALDYIVVQQLDGSAAGTHTEASSNEVRLYQVSCFARTAEAALAMRELVVGALDNVALDLAPTDIPQLVDDGRDSFDEVVNLFRADADFLV